MGKLNFKAMKIIKILVLVTIALMFNASSIVIAQESAKDSTKNPLATLFKGKRALKEEKDNAAAAQQQEAKDVTTENSSALQQQDAIESANSGVGPQKTGTSGNYFVEYEYYKARCEFYQKKCLEYKDGYTKWKKAEEDVERLKNDKDAIIASKDAIIASRDVTIADLEAKIKKLDKIKAKAIHDLETKIAEAKKLPISKLEEELNACRKEYESLGEESDPDFKTARNKLDKLEEDLKLFNGIVKDKNSTLKSPYSAERVNSALKTIEVLKENSDGCVKRCEELDRTATLLKEYESITKETRNLIDYVGDFLALFKKYNSKQIKNEIDYDSDLKTQLEKTNSIPYLKEQYDLFWKELENGSLNSDSVKAFIQKVENK